MCFELCLRPHFANVYLPWSLLLLKTFSCPHVLFIKGLISTAGSHDEWQKMPAGSPRKGSRREQGGIFFCLFRTLKSNFSLATWAKDSGSQQLLIWEAPVPALWPGCHWHSSCMSESRLAWKSGPAVLFPEGWLWVGLLQMAEKKWETHSVKNLSYCGWTFLDKCCLRVPPLPTPFLLILVVCWLTSSPTKGKRWLWFVVFANFHYVNALPGLPTWCHWTWSWEDRTHVLLPFMGPEELS